MGKLSVCIFLSVAVLLALSATSPISLADSTWYGYDNAVPYVQRSCYNVTHMDLKVIYNYTEDVYEKGLTASNETHIMRQIVKCDQNCTSGRCSSDNLEGDVTATVLMWALGLVLISFSMWLGIPFGWYAKRETQLVTFDARLALRLMMFWLGFWFLIGGASMFHGWVTLYGLSTGTVEIAQTVVFSLTWTAYLFMALTLLEIIAYILAIYADMAKKREGGLDASVEG